MGRAGIPHRHETPAAFRQQVLEEIDRRAGRGRPLNSGANRGDWLYAAAVRFFGSWGAAVEAAGYCYSDVRRRNLSPEDVLNSICELAEAGEPLLAGRHELLRANACRHFGSWKAAIEAAGYRVPAQGFWTADKVVQEILDELNQGLPMTTLAVLARNERLYGAARRQFGSWASALAAVDPALLGLRWQRSQGSGPLR